MKRVLSAKQLQQPSQKLAQHGELQAQHFLQQQNYLIIATNVRLGRNEIDIVAADTDREELVFVEVKTRAQDCSAEASRMVNWRKLRALRTAAKGFLQRYQAELPTIQAYRFDILVVIPGTIHHYQNVTW